MRRMMGTLAAIIAAVASVPAQAAWMKATTKHFVVYANETPEAIMRRASDLELVDAMLRRIHGVDGAADDANKLTLYVTPDLGALRRLYGDSNSGVAGFYVPRVEGAVAFTPRQAGEGGRATLSPQIVLFHEYAHHFMLGNYNAAYPGWFSEGYAEVASTIKIEDTRIVFGSAANHRARGIFANDGLTIEQLFAPPARQMSDAEVESMYARGWLLTHYLLMNPAHTAELGRYVRDLNAGMPSLEAARGAFGDLRKLSTALDRYVRKSTLPARIADRANFGTPAVRVEPLAAGPAAMIVLRMASTRGVNPKTAAPLYARGAKIAAAYPVDATVQGWLAEMAFDAGDLPAAGAAADRALVADPSSAQALLYKARVGLRQAQAAHADAATFKAARAYIVRANQLSNDDAAALHLYYESFAMAGEPPTANAKAALQKALELVPQDRGLRLQAVGQLIADDKRDEARRRLLPLAYDPHSRADSPARRLLAALDAKQYRAALLQAAGSASAAPDTD